MVSLPLIMGSRDEGGRDTRLTDSESGDCCNLEGEADRGLDGNWVDGFVAGSENVIQECHPRGGWLGSGPT